VFLLARHRQQQEKTPMYKEAPGKWMADWFDVDGKRKRKQFTSPTQAQRHEHEQLALVRAEQCARELDLSVHHTFRHKTARAAIAKKAAAIITTPAAERTGTNNGTTKTNGR
jgi:hypothetical protein